MSHFQRTCHRVLAFALILAVTTGLPALASEPYVDPQRVFVDLQQQSADPESLALVFWMPEEFWRFIMTAGGPAMPEEQLQEALGVLHPYMIFAVIDGTIGPFGGMTFAEDAAIRSTFEVVDREGKQYRPLPPADIAPDAQNLITMMKSIMAANMGQMGAGMHFLFVPATDADGKRFAAVREEGAFTVKLGKQSFDFRLPLGAFLPPKTCPVDGESLDGAWKYCPYHGSELKAQGSPEPSESEKPE
ncbi:MAG: hypothetical protein GY719_05435 [bacterium]|nr:hypothetical protein [bacterium]